MPDTHTRSRGSSRFESLVLSHHYRFNVTCECNKEEINHDGEHQELFRRLGERARTQLLGSVGKPQQQVVDSFEELQFQTAFRKCGSCFSVELELGLRSRRCVGPTNRSVLVSRNCDSDFAFVKIDLGHGGGGGG